MIREARALPTAMLVVGAAMLVGFLAIAVATILSVRGSKLESPHLEDLALPATVEIVDSHATCDASACDGFGLVVDRDGMDVAEMEIVVADRLRMDGWLDDAPCPQPMVCLRRDDLRVEIQPWLDLDEAVAPTLRASLVEHDVDQSRLVYVGFYRCGVLRSCV